MGLHRILLPGRPITHIHTRALMYGRMLGYVSDEVEISFVGAKVGYSEPGFGSEFCHVRPPLLFLTLA